MLMVTHCQRPQLLQLGRIRAPEKSRGATFEANDSNRFSLVSETKHESNSFIHCLVRISVHETKKACGSTVMHV